MIFTKGGGGSQYVLCFACNIILSFKDELHIREKFGKLFKFIEQFFSIAATVL